MVMNAPTFPHLPGHKITVEDNGADCECGWHSSSTKPEYRNLCVDEHIKAVNAAPSLPEALLTAFMPRASSWLELLTRRVARLEARIAVLEART